jgi:uncharacterized membrane protein
MSTFTINATRVTQFEAVIEAENIAEAHQIARGMRSEDYEKHGSDTMWSMNVEEGGELYDEDEDEDDF